MKCTQCGKDFTEGELSANIEDIYITDENGELVGEKDDKDIPWVCGDCFNATLKPPLWPPCN